MAAKTPIIHKDQTMDHFKTEHLMKVSAYYSDIKESGSRGVATRKLASYSNYRLMESMAHGPIQRLVEKSSQSCAKCLDSNPFKVSIKKSRDKKLFVVACCSLCGFRWPVNQQPTEVTQTPSNSVDNKNTIKSPAKSQSPTLNVTPAFKRMLDLKRPRQRTALLDFLKDCSQKD